MRPSGDLHLRPIALTAPWSAWRSRAGGLAPHSPARGAAAHRFILLQRRWVIDRSFAWIARFRRLVRDDERLAETLFGFHFVAFAVLMEQGLLSWEVVCRNESVGWSL